MTANRKRLFHVNRYQLRILALVLAPPVIIIIVLSLLTNLFFDQLIGAVETGSSTNLVSFLGQWKYNAFLALWGMLTVVVLITYMVSKNLLGAFGRIFRELDEMIDGRRTMPITARKKDDLANELLQRVNVLAERSPHNDD